jgi:hypothetical protein
MKPASRRSRQKATSSIGQEEVYLPGAKKMRTEQKESPETKTYCAETEEDLGVPQKYWDKDWRDFYFVTL